MSETVNHRKLKALSIDWLRAKGCDAFAFEVKLPLSNYRVDVAGYRSCRKMVDLPGETFAVGCKQSRTDFLRDSGLEEETGAACDELKVRVRELRDLLAVHLPQCRCHQSLFYEYDTYDFCDWRHDAWYRLTRRLQTLENRLSHGMKFAKIARYGCANYCYIAVDDNVVSLESEIPMGWGLLRKAGDGMEVAKEALRLDSRLSVRLKLLERIAKSRSEQRSTPRLQSNSSKRNE